MTNEELKFEIYYIYGKSQALKIIKARLSTYIANASEKRLRDDEMI